MKVYIVRHGQVLYNALGYYSVLDEDLNEVGIMEAEELREKIQKVKFDIIISSPLVRAMHTANIINVHNQEILLDERIRERDVGDLGGKPLAVTNREEYWNYNTTTQYGTSENIRVFFQRIYDFLEELKKKDYESVLVVAHSGVSKASSAYFDGIADGKFLDRGLKNCEIKEYEL